MEAELTKVSSKGQIVIPKTIRKRIGLRSGETLAVFMTDSTIVMKKVTMPSPKETFKEVSLWGRKFAKQRKIRANDIPRIIHKSRGVGR